LQNHKISQRPRKQQIAENINNIKKNNPDQFSNLTFDGQVFESKGCEICDGLGYK
jgi:hypothetical protein